ncbi:hypothetical protein Hanom_Chr11g01034511 [Helianthus anomalus]
MNMFMNRSRTHTERDLLQWRTQELFVGSADEWFKHIFKGCGRVFCIKNTLIFFFKGRARPPRIIHGSAPDFLFVFVH